MTLFVVMGPPAGGKSTWVGEHASAGDLVVDYDALCNALTFGGVSGREYSRPVAETAYRARLAAVKEAMRYAYTHDVYVIHSVPNQRRMAEYAACEAQFVVCDPGVAVTRRRCAAGRPADMMRIVDRWYDKTPVVPTGTRGRTSRSW